MRRSPRISPEDVGAYFIRDGELWCLIGYCEYPTARFERVSDKEMLGGAVGCRLFEGLQRLAPVDE